MVGPGGVYFIISKSFLGWTSTCFADEGSGLHASTMLHCRPALPCPAFAGAEDGSQSATWLTVYRLLKSFLNVLKSITDQAEDSTWFAVWAWNACMRIQI